MYRRLTLALVGLVLGIQLAVSSGLAALLLPVVTSSYLLVVVGFMLLTAFAGRLARDPDAGPSGLVLLVAAHVLLFSPFVLLVAEAFPGALLEAAALTAVMVVALHLVATRSARDFRWLSGLLRVGFLLALVTVVLSLLFGFQLSTLFTLSVLLLASGAILHDTQRIADGDLTGSPTRDAMLLFSSIALMFWYVLRLVAASRR